MDMPYNTTQPYGFIYITTNLINGKKYIGQKKFNDKWKNYLGSGDNLKKAVKLYGKENFARDIVYIAYDKKELNKAEIIFINQHNAVNSDDYYNIAYGGMGGAIYTEHPYSTKTDDELKEIRSKLSEARLIKIKCVETDEVFYGYEEAEEYYQIAKSGIAKYFNRGYRCGLPSNKLGINLNFQRYRDGAWQDRECVSTKKKVNRQQKVLCVETNKVFRNYREAEIYYDLKEGSVKCNVVGKRYKSGILSNKLKIKLNFVKISDKEYLDNYAV